MRRIVAILIPLFVSLFSFAQQPPRAAAGGGMNSGRFYGRIIDEATDKGIDAASVQLTVSRGGRDTIIAGMLTRKSGEFSLENLPVMGKFTLQISAIGYQTISRPLAFELKPGGDPSQMAAAIDRDLGNLKLAVDTQLLASVVVSAEKPLMQMGIDRKIFNVDKNINSVGGTAVDIMRNIPSLNVDIDGNVSMRNAAPQIYVDGRPTTMSLDQIPSEAIEAVELITNPSAKFDASGGQSGILNIVLKKQRKVGYNGGLRAGIDTRGRINSGADINVRQGKLNVFASASYNQRKSKSWGETERLTLAQEPNTSTLQENDGVFRGGFAFSRFGVDYFLNNRNTLSLSQNIMGGDFNIDNRNNLLYKNTDGSGLESQYRNTIGKNKWRNYNTALGYKRLFTQPGRELTADVNFSYSPSSGYSNILIRSFNDIAQESPKFPEQLQNITSDGKNRFVVAQADYIHPLGASMKWEAGLRSQTRTFESNQYNFYNGVSQPQIDNRYKYTDFVHAGYVTFSQKIENVLNYQVGLRAESSNYDGEQINKQNFRNEFPLSLFPSLFLTKSIGDKQDLQLNYSRKVNRPSFFQLMPNTDFSDTLNLQTGNPDLKPEFTNSLELSYQKTYGKRNNNFLATIFGKQSTNLIARYQSLREFGDTTAFVSSYINASKGYAAGLELIFKNSINAWWEINLNTNVYYSKINGSNVVAGLENERTSSFTKLNNTFKVTKTLSIQLSGDYQSKSALPISTSNSGGGGRGSWMGAPSSSSQGYIDANYGIDIGVKKEFKIKKNQASLSFNMNDVLRTRKNVIHSESPYFIQDEWRRRDPQVARLTFSYRFGKFDMSLFKRKNTRTETEGMGGGMEGQ